MGNSALICYTKISPNSNPRRHDVYNPTGRITKITIHHMAGNLSVETCGKVFQNNPASANYGVGTDGRIAMYVPEDRRAWTSSSADNDYKAVTIEVANDGGAPDWHVSDKALEATIELCVDICQRNGIEQLNYTGNTSGNLTMHKWFAATACPGPYLGGKFPYIAQEVNRRLEAARQPQAAGTLYRVQVGAYSVKANAEKQLAKMRELGYTDAFIAVVDGKLYRVQVGAFAIKANAEKLQAKIREQGIKAIVTTLSGEPLAADPAPAPQIKKGSTVRVRVGAKTYTGGGLADFIYHRDHKVLEISGDRVVITYGGAVVAAVKLSDLSLV
jgi:hypothetical protein